MFSYLAGKNSFAPAFNRNPSRGRAGGQGRFAFRPDGARHLFGGNQGRSGQRGAAYQKVVAQAKADRTLAAQAQYHLGFVIINKRTTPTRTPPSNVGQGLFRSKGDGCAGPQISGRRSCFAAGSMDRWRGHAAGCQTRGWPENWRCRLLGVCRPGNERPKILALQLAYYHRGHSIRQPCGSRCGHVQPDP